MPPLNIKSLASNVKEGSLSTNAAIASRRETICSNVTVRVILFALAALSFLSGSLVAQAVKPEERSRGPRFANEQVRSTEGAIFRAGALEGAAVQTKDGNDAGKIHDLILDLDTGRVALLVLGGQEVGTGSTTVVAPMSALRELDGKGEMIRLSSEQIHTAPHPPKSNGEITREWTGVALDHFGIAPYWNSEKLDVEISPRDVLPRASSMHNVVVTDQDGKELGRIVDFAVTARGDIAYAGLAMNGDDQKLHPVPLSAFVVPVGNSQWQLRIPRDIVANTPTFAVSNWPKSLDRGWLEYVHVRYGRSVFDGVNRSLQPNQAKATK